MSIFVSGADVYVAGFQVKDLNNPNKQAMYWKNGSPTSLSDGTIDEKATNITFLHSDVYVNVIVNGSSILYKNGKAVSPFDGTNTMIQGTGMFVN
jgi:hypothetical protein